MSEAAFLASLAVRVPRIAARLATEAVALKTIARRDAIAGTEPWGMRFERAGADWLTGVLRENDALGADHSVTSLRRERFGEIGQMSIVFRVTPSYSAGARGPRTLILKSTAPELRNRLFNALFNVFETELRTYRLPEPESGLLRPRFWYGAQHPTSRAALMVLEDLDGWRFVPTAQKLTPDEALRVTRALGEHHARWWNDRSLRDLGFKDSAEVSRDSTGPLYALAWRKAQQVMSPLVEPEILALIGEFVERQDALCRHFVRGATTLLHGDLNTNNLFFDDAGDRICAIDWQAARIGSWSEDLGYLLLTGLSGEDLEAHEDRLLATHREALARGGVVVDAAEHEAEYGLGILAAAGILVLASLVIDPKKDPVLFDRYRTTIGEWSRVARRRRVGDALRSLER